MRRSVIFAFAVACGTPAFCENSPPAEYFRVIGKWTIAGDYSAGGCMAEGLTDGGTSLSIATFPNRSDYAFSLQNDAWRSLAHGAELRVNAHLYSNTGKLTDSWSLASHSYKQGDDTPTINFVIERAENDQASFRNQIARSGKIAFFRDRIPVASFNLVGSAAALDALDACRAQLRRNRGFDPFAE